MRTQKDVDSSLRHNERKFLVLSAIAKSTKYQKPAWIADQCEITNGNALRQLTKLYGQGYLWRRKAEDGTYRYHHLKPMGERTLKELWIRTQIRILTDDNAIPLNLKKPIPAEHYHLHERFENEYYEWLYA
jgi:DNA-binding MarR family transcriptional regulator